MTYNVNPPCITEASGTEFAGIFYFFVIVI